MTPQQLEVAIDEVILESGLPAGEVVEVMNSMMRRYEEAAADAPDE